MDYSAYNDFVQKVLYQISECRGKDAEGTLSGCRELLEYGENINDSRLIGFAYYHMAETYYMLNEVDKVFLHITKSLEYLVRGEMWNEVAQAYNILAIMALNRGNAPFALDYYISGLSYAEKYNLSKVRYIINLNIGNLYISYGEYRQALKYFEESKKYFEECSADPDVNPIDRAVIYISIGTCYLEMDSTDAAENIEKLVMSEKMLEMGTMEKIYMYCYQARLYNKLGNELKRDKYIKLVSEVMSDNLMILDMFSDLYAYAEMLLDIENYDELWSFLQILEKLAKKGRIINQEKQILGIKIKYYKKTKDRSGYLQAAGLYYEMCELSEKDNRSMINTMLDVRFSLEEAKRRQKETENENQYLHLKSETDPLTGISNRYRFNTMAEMVLNRAVKEGKMIGMEILDIDYFKEFNDNYGHQAGDECIIQIADAVKNMESMGNVYSARYGGDEFVIIYEGYDMENVEQMAYDLKQSVMQKAISHEFSKVMPIVTVSQGICCDIPTEKTRVWDYLHKADEMLYAGKKLSRNSIFTGNLEKN